MRLHHPSLGCGRRAVHGRSLGEGGRGLGFDSQPGVHVESRQTHERPVQGSVCRLVVEALPRLYDRFMGL